MFGVNDTLKARFKNEVSAFYETTFAPFNP